MYLNVYAILVYSLVKSVLSLSITLTRVSRCTLTASRYRYAQSRLINPLILHASRLLPSVTSALMHALPASPNVVIRLVPLIIYSAGYFPTYVGYSLPGIFQHTLITHFCRYLSLKQILFVTCTFHVFIQASPILASSFSLSLFFSSYAQCDANFTIHFFHLDCEIFKIYRKTI